MNYYYSKTKFCLQANSRFSFLMNYVLSMQFPQILENQIIMFNAEIFLAQTFAFMTRMIFKDLESELIFTYRNRTYIIYRFLIATHIQVEHTYTILRIPEYLVSEIIVKAGYNYEVDFQILGIVIYEILSGDLQFI